MRLAWLNVTAEPLMPILDDIEYHRPPVGEGGVAHAYRLPRESGALTASPRDCDECWRR